jgi:hypothetical protein
LSKSQNPSSHSCQMWGFRPVSSPDSSRPISFTALSQGLVSISPSMLRSQTHQCITHVRVNLRSVLMMSQLSSFARDGTIQLRLWTSKILSRQSCLARKSSLSLLRLRSTVQYSTSATLLFSHSHRSNSMQICITAQKLVPSERLPP